MSNNNTAVAEAAAEVDSQSEVEARLAAIAAAVAERTKAAASSAPKQYDEGMACPIDPAERALCEGCQYFPFNSREGPRP
jgi:hypothetical protein